MFQSWSAADMIVIDGVLEEVLEFFCYERC